MNGIEAIGSAVSELSDVNMYTEMTKASEIVTLIMGTAGLSEQWLDRWNVLARQYSIDLFNAVADPSATATASADYSKYQQAQQQGQFELGQQDNILQTNKGVLKQMGTAMSQIYNLVLGPIQLQKATNTAILMMS